MREMFDGASSFNSDISMWDVSSATDMNNMFNDATSFIQNLAPWYVILNDTRVKDDTLVVGTISAQNAYLDSQNPIYVFVAGDGDTDNSLFTITGNALSIKEGPATQR